jgi:hypothetical protein
VKKWYGTGMLPMESRNTFVRNVSEVVEKIRCHQPIQRREKKRLQERTKSVVA